MTPEQLSTIKILLALKFGQIGQPVGFASAPTFIITNETLDYLKAKTTFTIDHNGIPVVSSISSSN